MFSWITFYLIFNVLYVVQCEIYILLKYTRCKIETGITKLLLKNVSNIGHIDVNASHQKYQIVSDVLDTWVDEEWKTNHFLACDILADEV